MAIDRSYLMAAVAALSAYTAGKALSTRLVVRSAVLHSKCTRPRRPTFDEKRSWSDLIDIDCVWSVFFSTNYMQPRYRPNRLRKTPRPTTTRIRRRRGECAPVEEGTHKSAWKHNTFNLSNDTVIPRHPLRLRSRRVAWIIKPRVTRPLGDGKKEIRFYFFNFKSHNKVNMYVRIFYNYF